MLTLARKINEIIMIGDDICIRVVGLNRHKVLLGITAPREIAVHREEIYKRIQQEARQLLLSKNSINDKFINQSISK